VTNDFSSRRGTGPQAKRMDKENIIGISVIPMALAVDVIFRLK
jgi:hypothetical protein